jgi:DNA-binding MarR family transcriptional regulator
MDIIKELEDISSLPKDGQKILSNLYYTHFWLADKYTEILAIYSLTPQQANILGIVRHFNPKPLTLQEIKSLLMEKNSDVSRIVARLIDKKLLHKTVDKKNRRKVKITINLKGIKIIDKITEDKLFDKFISKFSLEDARIFAKLLAKLRVE